MKKSTIATTAGLGLTAIALAVAPVHSGSKNHEQAMGLELDIVAAAAIATDSTDARVIEAEFESKRDKLFWEIEMIDSENREIEVKVDINTGEIISQETEGKHRKDSIADMGETLSMADAVAIVKGAAQGDVIEAELEGEDGELIWELKLIGNDKGKYRVNANSGELLP